jgi:hypothetical protein
MEFGPTRGAEFSVISADAAGIGDDALISQLDTVPTIFSALLWARM